MRVVALSLAGVDTSSFLQYAKDLTALLEKENAALAVLPAHCALALYYGSSRLKSPSDFHQAFRLFCDKAQAWNADFLALHAELAGKLGIYLVAGSTVEKTEGHVYHTSYCFDPRGEICAAQRQTHLDRMERGLGLSRGVELKLFELNGMKAGIAVCTDARHPEVGRIFSLQGADLIIHPGALASGANCRSQAAGMWAQVQQNQCWAVEAQLYGAVCGRRFAAECFIIGPCEVTADLSGYLARAFLSAPVAAAELDEAARDRVRQAYPILRLLNPEAYRGGLFDLERVHLDESGA